MIEDVGGAKHQVQVDYHQMFFAPFDVQPVMTPDQDARLLNIATDQSSVFISTGCANGTVTIDLRVLDEPPAPLDSCMAGWEVGAEQDVRIDADLHLGAPTLTMVEPVTIRPSTPGLHRVRVLARGRAAHYDLFIDESGEEYEVSFWPVTSTRGRADAGDDGVEL